MCIQCLWSQHDSSFFSFLWSAAGRIHLIILNQAAVVDRSNDKEARKTFRKIWEVAHSFLSAILILYSLELSCSLREIY